MLHRAGTSFSSVTLKIETNVFYYLEFKLPSIRRSEIREELLIDNPCSVTSVASVTFLNRKLDLGGMGLGVAPRTDTKKTCVYKRLDYVFKIR